MALTPCLIHILRALPNVVAPGNNPGGPTCALLGNPCPQTAGIHILPGGTVLQEPKFGQNDGHRVHNRRVRRVLGLETGVP